MTIETIWQQLGRIIEGYRASDGTTFRKSADPFTFDLDPRGDVPAYYIGAPTMRTGSEYMGGGSAELARFTVWLSRPRGDDADAAVQRVMGDLVAIRRFFEDDTADWHIPSRSVRIRGGVPAPPATHVLGSVELGIDFEAA